MLATQSTITIGRKPRSCIEIDMRATLACGKDCWYAQWSHAVFVCSINHVMVNWHLSKQGICWSVSHDHIMSSGLELIDVTFFLKTKYRFLIGSRAYMYVQLYCSNQGPGLKAINQSIDFSCLQMFPTAFGWWAPGVVWGNSNSLVLGKLCWVLNNPAQQFHL